MTTIVVGYVPKAEGHAALRRGAEEARLRGARLVVINSARGGREFDAEDAVRSDAELEAAPRTRRGGGIDAEVPAARAAGMSPTTSSPSPRRPRPISSSSGYAAARRWAS